MYGGPAAGTLEGEELTGGQAGGIMLPSCPPPQSCRTSSNRLLVSRFFLVRPAGRTHLEVKVLYSPGKGKS